LFTRQGSIHWALFETGFFESCWDVYGAAKAAGPPGEFEIRLSLDSAGEVYAIDVALRGYMID
jgi:hypothetical protein